MEQRRRQAAESLLAHSLFGFQIHDTVIMERLRELQELLVATCTERDQIALLSENIREIEDQLKTHSERFMLEPLRRFEQEMELLLDVGSENDEDMMKEEDSLLLTEDEECLSLSQEPLISTISHPLTPLNKNNITKQKKPENEEVVCGVCYTPDSLENDPIVICEVCGVAVHQTCCRLAVVPEGDWYCHPCRQYLDAEDMEKNLMPTHELKCEACCTKAGAMTPTVDGKWVHVACFMFLPELYLQHASRFQGLPDDLQVVCGLEKLKQRRRLRCCFCKKNNEKGACAQCAVGKCVVAYHALCALQNGIKLRYMEDQGQFGSGCLKHQAKFLKVDRDVEADVNVGGGNGVTLLEEADKFKTRRPRNNSWSDEGGSASDDINDDNNELDSDSDSDDSQNSLSDDNYCLSGKKQQPSTQPAQTKMSPPRLSRLSKSGGKYFDRPKRSQHNTLSFASVVDTPTLVTNVPAPPATRDAAPALATHSRLASHTHKDVSSNSRVVLQSNVFAPSFYPPTYIREDPSERDFEYVMVIITSRPLGLGIVSMMEGSGIFLRAQSTRNPAILAALERGVIQDGDEVFAFNDLTLRNTGLERFENDVVPALSLPVYCWFRTRRKSNMFTPTTSEVVPVCVASPVQNVPGTSVAVKQQAVTSPSELVRPNTYSPGLSRSSDASREVGDEVMSGGIDWPWVFLRSDGKLAMKLFWKTLDSAFFLQKINKRTFTQLQRKVEGMCGVHLNRSHLDDDQVRELLVTPRRERLPAYLVNFRNMRKQKQKSLLSDILTGASGDADINVDEEETAVEVGTTVSVAKRTWPGMNKLGGVGRIKKVNEEILPNGKKRFTYDVAYVLSGNEKNVERKYISVVDLDAVEPDKSEENCSTLIGRRQKCEPETDVKATEEIDASTLSMRLFIAVSRTADTENLTTLPDVGIGRPPKRCRFQLQFLTEDSSVYCERKTGHLDHVLPAKELLMHRHFEVNLSQVDALINACFTSEVLSIEDRIGDEVGEDDTESEDEDDNIKSELATLQQQFRSVMESNELAFSYLTTKVEEEYASKGYRQHELQKIQWRNYERMYQELQAARRQFNESDEGSDVDEDGRAPGSGTKAESDEGENSENEDISFGGMFVNKLKQEGSEVCALCELSGGDFTATDTGRVVHPQCAMFTPETFFKDGVVHGIDLVDPQRQQLKCSICGGRKGLSKIQCTHRKCARAYHVACAFVNGLLTINSCYQAWCPRHLKTSGMEQFVELPHHLDKEKSTHSAISSSCNSRSATLASPPTRRKWKASKPRSSRQKKSRGYQDTLPAKVMTIARADISSFKANRKRKRKGSIASAPANTSMGSHQNTRENRGSSLRNTLLVEGDEPRCARRLKIDEVSDDSDHEGKAVEVWQQGRDLQRVFLKSEVVEVLARDWRGTNKPGGVARVRAVELVPNKNGGKDAFYDVVHIVGAFREKRLPAKFVRSYETNAE